MSREREGDRKCILPSYQIHSDTSISPTESVLRLIPLCGPIHLFPCVSEEHGDGEGPGLETLSDTLMPILDTSISPDHTLLLNVDRVVL